MPSSYEIIPAQTLGASAAQALYPSPTGISTRIEKLTFYNADTASHVVTVYLVPSGFGVAAGTTILYQQPVGAHQTLDDTNVPGHYLSPGDALWAFADTAGFVNIFAAGSQLS